MLHAPAASANAAQHAAATAGGSISLGQHLEGQRQQGVAGQNGRGLVERLVAGGPPATQIVVVHRRQIVVDQRIGVDHLDRAGGRHGRLDRPAAGLGGQQHQHRPQPLARGQQAIAHRLAESRRAAVAQAESERPRPRRFAAQATEQVRQTKRDDCREHFPASLRRPLWTRPCRRLRRIADRSPHGQAACARIGGRLRSFARLVG